MTDIYSLTYEQAEKLLTENGFKNMIFAPKELIRV